MTERDAFIRAIAENLYDDTPRLAFADWLDEHGDPARAEFIRVQCELEPMRDQYEIPHAAELHEREDKLLYYPSELYKEWTAGLPNYPTHGWAVGYDFRRGFIDTIKLPAARFIRHGGELRAAHPTIRRVVIFQFNGWGERLAVCAALNSLPELELACWYSDDDIRALAASPHLTELQVLELWLGRLSELGTDDELCRIAAQARAWPRLRELVLLDPDGEQRESGPAHRLKINEIAKRELARYEQGYPDLFPFAPGNRVGEPGYLPDGRMAIVSARATGDPARYEVLTFDVNGEQTSDVLYASVPDQLLALPKRDWYLGEHKFHDQVCKAIGLRSAFIRIKGYTFPSRPNEGARRGRYEEWDRLGYPDPGPESAPDGVDYDGNGETIYRLVRNGEFTVGMGGWWCDKRGHVHST